MITDFWILQKEGDKSEKLVMFFGLDTSNYPKVLETRCTWYLSCVVCERHVVVVPLISMEFSCLLLFVGLLLRCSSSCSLVIFIAPPLLDSSHS